MARTLKKSKRRADTEEPSINLTPLIDVVFSILIMFIVVAPLLEVDVVALAKKGEGSADSKPVKESGPIVIHVRKDNTVHLNHQLVDLGKLPQLLKHEKEKHPSANPQLYHDKQAYFGTYQAVKNSVEAAGFEQMDVILNP